MFVSVVKDYEAFMKKVLGPVSMKIAGHQVQRLLGFWVCWHMLRGVDGLRLIGMADNSIRRQRKEFEQVFHVKVEEFLPELIEAIQKEVKVADE